MFKAFATILVLFFSASFSGLHLKDDLIHDRGRLNEHGVYLSNADKNKLKMFDKYSRMNLSGFKCAKQTSGRHIVTSWTNGTKKIYEVQSVLPASPTYEIKDIETGKVTTEINPYKGTSIFRTYMIDFPNQKRLIYQTQVNEGLIYFSIGKKRYNPVKEEITLGMNYPNEKEITDLTN